MFAKHHFGFIQTSTHTHVLCTLAGKHECHRPLLRILDRRKDALGFERIEQVDCICEVVANHRAAVIELLASGREREGNIGQRSVRVLS